MVLKIKRKEGVSLSLRWHEAYAWGVTISMLLFGLWGFYDGIEVGSITAGLKFILFFLIILSPNFVILFFYKPKADSAE